MFRILAILLLLVLAVLVFAWVRKSKWFDNFCNSLESDPYPNKSTAKDRMVQINKEKEILLQQADINVKAVEALNKEKDEINEFLGVKDAIKKDNR